MRPTKYESAFCEQAVALGSEGKSKVEIAFDLGVDRKTIDNWAREHPEFFHAITRAKEAEQVWWERKGRDGLEKAVFKDGMWSRSMAARFPDDWREKVAHVGDKRDDPIQQEVTLTADAFTRRIAGAAARASEAGAAEQHSDTDQG